MDFVNRNLSSVLKIALTIIVLLIFIRAIPLLVVVGIAAWAGIKGVKFFKNIKNKRSNKYEKMDAKSKIYDEKDSFDFTGKNIIDVEYEEMKK